MASFGRRLTTPVQGGASFRDSRRRSHDALQSGLGFNATVEIVTIASRPDLAHLLGKFPLAWPAFMYQDPTASLYYADAATTYRSSSCWRSTTRIRRSPGRSACHSVGTVIRPDHFPTPDRTGPSALHTRRDTPGPRRTWCPRSKFYVPARSPRCRAFGDPAGRHVPQCGPPRLYGPRCAGATQRQRRSRRFHGGLRTARSSR